MHVGRNKNIEIEFRIEYLWKYRIHGDRNINKYWVELNYVTGDLGPECHMNSSSISFSIIALKLINRIELFSLTFAITSNRCHGGWLTADIKKQTTT